MVKTSEINTILLDRDGTLIKEQHYLCDPALVHLIPGVAAPWRQLAAQGCHFFLVTNQSGIGRSKFSIHDYHQVHAQLLNLLAREKIMLTDSAFCPHTPEDHCACRKPLIGLWQTLATRHHLKAQHAAMIGDKAADLYFGHNLGCQATVLVHTGYGQETAAKLGLPPLQLAVQPCPDQPGWPSYQARTLGDYLNHLVQNRTIVHAHRI